MDERLGRLLCTFFGIHIVTLVLIMVLLLSPLFSAHGQVTESDVVDNAGILSEMQVDNINKALAELDEAKVLIVINDVGNRTTDDYAYSVAKELYNSTFSNEKYGVVIVYCSALEGFKVGVYGDEALGVNYEKLKEKITDRFQANSSDSLWIQNSAINAIGTIINRENAIKEAAKPTPTPTAKTQAEKTPELTNEPEEEANPNLWTQLKNSFRSINNFFNENRVVIALFGIVFLGGCSYAAWRQKKGKDDDSNNTPKDNN
jgi:DNA polymerase III gamma/tau subunit